MIKENKANKYVLYAIGEIFLVVIGILIALQVSNWNTESQNKDIQISLLQKLDVELQSNIDRLNYLSGRYEKLTEKNFTLIDTLLIGINEKKIETYLKNTFYVSSTLNLSSSVYEQMKNTGQLYALKSDSLLNAIELNYRLYERENYYIIQINRKVGDKLQWDIDRGIAKAKYDYKAKGLDFAIQNNIWLLNNQSEEYYALLRHVIYATSNLRDIIRRIDKMIEGTEYLKDLIKKELEK